MARPGSVARTASQTRSRRSALTSRAVCARGPIARWGIVATIAGFVLQTVIASGLVVIAGVESITLTIGALIVSALVASVTGVAAALALRAAPRLGGRAIATLALGVSILLGLAPVLLLVAIGLAGGI
jgi:hypothetical protein